MVRIRLARVGAKKQPSYRVVVADQHSPRDGRFIEIIGHYNPRTEPATMVVKEDRALYWLGRGAQPSEAVARILDKTGVLAKVAQPTDAPSEASENA
jgi:small subunit ribosomal protein S16